MPEFKSKWWTPETTTSESNTPKDGTDKTDKRAFVSNVSAFPKDIPSGTGDLSDSVSTADGVSLADLASEVHSTRLIAQCRAKAVEVQAWLIEHFDQHMDTLPYGSPEWIAAMAEFGVIEGGQLRNNLGYIGCIHTTGSCPAEAPVNCTACEADFVI